MKTVTEASGVPPRARIPWVGARRILESMSSFEASSRKLAALFNISGEVRSVIALVPSFEFGQELPPGCEGGRSECKYWVGYPEELSMSLVWSEGFVLETDGPLPYKFTESADVGPWPVGLKTRSA